MRYLPLLLLVVVLACGPAEPVIQTEAVSYLNRPHFRIQTPVATWYYDRAGGGFSSLIDSDNRDWIGFRMEPWDQFPASAASAFRGIPNAVYQSEDSGAGHPGHEQCESVLTENNQITTQSKSGRWAWTWTFHDTYAELSIDKIDTSHAYWFLYEGTPGGRFAPAAQYFGTDLGGPRHDQLDYYVDDKEFARYRWAYFGDTTVEQVLFIGQMDPDTLLDTFAYLGNTDAGIEAPDGMVVFGLGRAPGPTPILTRRHTFIVGFWPKAIRDAADHEELANHITLLLTQR